MTLFPGHTVKAVVRCKLLPKRLTGCSLGFASALPLLIKCGEYGPCYPWKLAIVSTVFWVGENNLTTATGNS
jgi:hypothetical protein